MGESSLAYPPAPIIPLLFAVINNTTSQFVIKNNHFSLFLIENVIRNAFFKYLIFWKSKNVCIRWWGVFLGRERIWRARPSHLRPPRACKSKFKQQKAHLIIFFTVAIIFFIGILICFVIKFVGRIWWGSGGGLPRDVPFLDPRQGRQSNQQNKHLFTTKSFKFVVWANFFLKIAYN